jgi:hypothetical protein
LKQAIQDRSADERRRRRRRAACVLPLGVLRVVLAFNSWSRSSDNQCHYVTLCDTARGHTLMSSCIVFSTPCTTTRCPRRPPASRPHHDPCYTHHDTCDINKVHYVRDTRVDPTEHRHCVHAVTQPSPSAPAVSGTPPDRLARQTRVRPVTFRSLLLLLETAGSPLG